MPPGNMKEVNYRYPKGIAASCEAVIFLR